MVILLGARTSPLGILLPCAMSGGIKAKVVPECVDRSLKDLVWSGDGSMDAKMED